MATIQEGVDLVTLIVIFHTTPETQGAQVETLRRVIDQHSQRDGFVSCSIHVSEDGTRVAEYIQWRSYAHLQVMLESEAGAAHVNDTSVFSEVHSYRISSVTHGPGAVGT